MRWLLVAGILLGLQGCSTLNQSECRSGDWFGIGLADGSRGMPLTRLAQHRKACSEYAVKVDGGAYRSGRREGLKTYCTPLNGFRAGRQGNGFNTVCPEPLNQPFYRAYRSGQQLYRLQQDISQLTQDKATEEQATLDETLSRDERRQHLDALKQIELRLDRLERRFKQAQRASVWESATF